MAAPAPLLPADADPSFAELLAGRPHLTMHAQDGLVMEEVPLARIAREHGTPSWVYSAGTLAAASAHWMARCARRGWTSRSTSR
jgi:diaminopimelate decarboxylase